MSAPRVTPAAAVALPPKSTAREYFESIVIAVILALFVRTWCFQAFKIPTGSMENNLLIGDHLVVNKFLFAPAGLDTAVLDKLYQSAGAALKSSDMVEALDRMGAKPAPMAPRAFAEFIRAEQAKYKVIVERSGATVD